MTRTQQLEQEVKQVSKMLMRSKMPDAKILSVEICFDLVNDFYTWAWSNTNVASGLQKQFIEKSGFTVCKKSDATLRMIIGEKNENGNWIVGKYKNYWCKPSL